MYLRTLGGLTLESGGRPILGAAGQRGRLAILSLIALSGDLGVSRDRLLALFWPNSDTERARGALKQALYALRRDVGEQELTLGTTALRLNPEVIRSDVGEFERAVEAEEFDAAAKLYGGPFLDGVHVDASAEFEQWTARERERLAQTYRSALERLARAAMDRGDLRVAVGWWRKLADADRLSARVARGYMDALVAAGDREAAIKHGRVYAELVRAELDAEPDAALLRYVEQLRGAPPIAPPAAANGSAPGQPGPVLRAPDDRAAADELSGASLESAVQRAGSPAVSAATPPPGARSSRRPWHLALVGVAGVAAIAGAILVLRPGRGPETPAPVPQRTAIAVLPFENLSSEPAYAYFAPGLQEELLTQLSKVAALTVISRTSAAGYAQTARPLREIAAELGVGSVVEGSVQVVANRLRVSVQLIDAATGRHLWAERYDRTLNDAFAVQSQIGQRIVEAVGATLTAAEARAIAAAPTAKAEAYQLYLQGLEYFQRQGNWRQNLEIAQHLFERALALDSTFALAHGALSQVHGDVYQLRYDPTAARAESQRREAEAALRLAPELPQTHFAMGRMYYDGHRDYRRALEEFNLALRGAPNDAELWRFIGSAHRRLGNWDSVEVAYAKASQLDPRNLEVLVNLGAETRIILRRYADAIPALRHALVLGPDVIDIREVIADIYAAWKGDLDTLKAFWRGPGGPGRLDVEYLGGHLTLLLWEREPDSLLALLRDAHRATVEGAEEYLPTALYAAWAHLLQGDARAVRAAFDSATVLLDSAVRALPEDWRLHAAHGQALAGLGRRRDALREALWLQQSDVYRRDHVYGPFLAQQRAQILARIGETDAALDEIAGLLAHPAYFISVQTLRLDPRWDPIRDQPRFQALLRKYAGR